MCLYRIYFYCQQASSRSISQSTMHAIKKGEVTKSARTEIITAIAFQVYTYTQYPSPEEYTTVRNELISKYPILKDTIGSGIVSFKCYM